MMLVNSNETPWALIYRYFSLKLEFSKTAAFLRIPSFGEFEFPGHPERLDLNCQVFRMQSAEQAPFKSRIFYDDPEAGFLNFYAKEKEFRWTSGSSQIANIQFPTSGKKVLITIYTRFAPPHASNMD